MSKRLTVSSWVAERLAEKLNEPGRAARYDAWLRLQETRDNVTMLQDIFCRPKLVGDNLTGKQALRAQGYQEGAWDVLDTLCRLRPPQEDGPDVQQDYGVDEKEELAKRKESSHGE